MQCCTSRTGEFDLKDAIGRHDKGETMKRYVHPHKDPEIEKEIDQDLEDIDDEEPTSFFKRVRTPKRIKIKFFVRR